MKTEMEAFIQSINGAINFRNQYPDFKSAWNNCPRGDWMLCLAKKLNIDNRKLTLAKGLCAKTVIHLMKDERSKKAVEIAIEYGKGKASREELNAADAYAADAVDAYAVDAYAADAVDTAKKENQKQTADICREILTNEIFKWI